MKAVIKDMKETCKKLGIDINIEVNYSNAIPLALVSKLREIHGTTNDAKPIAERKTEYTFEEKVKEAHKYSNSTNAT